MLERPMKGVWTLDPHWPRNLYWLHTWDPWASALQSHTKPDTLVHGPCLFLCRRPQGVRGEEMWPRAEARWIPDWGRCVHPFCLSNRITIVTSQMEV